MRVDARSDLGRARAGEAVAHRASGRRADRCLGVIDEGGGDVPLVAGESRVDARRQRQGAAVPPARDADLERQAELVVEEDAAAGVSLARVDAPLRISRAEHRRREEAASEGVDLGLARDVVDDRHGGLEQDVGGGAARGGHAPADDARERARGDVGRVLSAREPDALHARRSGGREPQERPVVRFVAALRLVCPPVHEVDLAHHLHRHVPEVVHADLGLDADPGQQVPVVVGDAVGGREQPAVADQRRATGAVGQAGDEDVDMSGPGPFAGSRRASSDDRGTKAYGRKAGRPDGGRVHSRGLPSHVGCQGHGGGGDRGQERDARGDDRNEPPRCAGNHPARLRAGRSQCQAERFATMRR